jgi:hypothetical protein
MTGFHCTTPKKEERYKKTGGILPPVRFWPNEYTARRWMKKTGRNVLVKIESDVSWPLPDHVPARWTNEIIRKWKEIK